jgi:hypothetical protein
MVIFGTRNLEPSEELAYDYKFPFEPKEKRIRCLCVLTKCRTWMNYCEGEVERVEREEDESDETDSEERSLPH